MKIDKARFLLLTGTLSAAAVAGAAAMGGCTVVSNSTDGGTDSGTTTDSGSTDGSTDGSSSTDGGADGSTDGGADAAACLDDNGPAAADCSDAGGCTCADPTTRAGFKKGVLAAIADCQLKLPTCEGNAAADQCEKDAVARACDDPTATTFCQPLVAGCANGVGQKITQQDCEKVVRALTAAGRATVESCVTEGVAGNCSTDSLLCVRTN